MLFHSPSCLKIFHAGSPDPVLAEWWVNSHYTVFVYIGLVLKEHKNIAYSFLTLRDAREIKKIESKNNGNYFNILGRNSLLDFDNFS